MRYLKSILEFLEIKNESVGYVKPSIDNELELDDSDDIKGEIEDEDEDIA